MRGKVFRLSDRMRAKLKEVKGELRQRMHQSIPEQGRWLKQIVTGYFAYHAVPINSRALQTFRNHIVDLWRRTLRRRSQTDRMTWGRISKVSACERIIAANARTPGLCTRARLTASVQVTDMPRSGAIEMRAPLRMRPLRGKTL